MNKIPNGATHRHIYHTQFIYYMGGIKYWMVWNPHLDRWQESVHPDRHLSSVLVPIERTKTMAQKLMEAF